VATVDQRPKLQCHVPGPDADATFRIFDLYFDGDRPLLVLAWQRDGQKPAQCVELDPAMLRRLGSSESLTFTYEGAVKFPSEFS
jgi:hypothetical protein